MDAAPAPKAIGHLEPIGNLIPSPLNPRKRFTVADLADLQANISRLHRVLTPILARPGKKAGQIEIVDGERRWRCAQTAKIEELPVVVEPLSDADALEIMLISAVLAQALTPLEEAEAFKKLITLGKGQHTLQTIGQKLGKDAKWVANRVRLTDLVPDAKEALNDGAILVGHAELLAKLKPTEQKKLVALPKGYFGKSGLWEKKDATIKFDNEPAVKSKFDGYRAKSVRELESWIATHIRFDAAHLSQTAPLEFGDTAEAIAAAEQRQKRGKKVVPISFLGMLNMDARDKDGARTYCKESWRKAGNKPCPSTVLGVVHAGEQYGRSFDVCVNKDCKVHWPKEAAERAKRKKAADQRAKGKPAKAEKVESPEAKAKREAAEEKAALESQHRHDRIQTTARRAIVQIVSSMKRLDGPILQLLAEQSAGRAEDCDEDLVDAVADDLGFDPKLFAYQARPSDFAKLKADDLVRVMVAGQMLGECSFYESDRELNKAFTDTCEQLGVDLKKIEAAVAKDQAERVALDSEKKLAGGKEVQAMRGAAKKAPAKAAKKAKQR